MRLHMHSTTNERNFQPLVDKALASSDPRQIEFLIRSIALSPADDTRKEQAFHDILRANKSVNNVVAMCLINLRAFGDEAVRKGVHCVLQQSDCIDTEVVKMCAIVRLIGLEQHSSHEAQLIAQFAFHASSSVRSQTRREVGGLPESRRSELIASNKPNVDADDLNAKYFDLLLRALPLPESVAS